MKIYYGFHATPFGDAIIGISDNSVCYLAFIDVSKDESFARLKKTWNEAELIEDKDLIDSFAQKIFYSSSRDFEIMLTGSELELSVWKILTTIPAGAIVSYEQVAEALERPKAVRAVASAIGRNHIAYIVPCHRVVRKSGGLGGYAFGLDIKRAIIEAETKRVESY